MLFFLVLWIVLTVIAGIVILSILLSRSSDDSDRPRTQTRKDRELYNHSGAQGEKAVIRRIGETLDGEKYVFNDYRFKVGDKTIQIDHIVVNQNGVFVIETKNYSGTIYGGDDIREWTQVLAYGNVVNKFYSPVKQNASHIYHLRKFLPKDIGIKSVVVFVQGNIDHINSESVIALNEIRNCLKADWGNSLSDQQIARVVKLLQLHKDDTITISEHVENIHKMKEKIDNNVCPRCGGKLVLRNGEYGNFYGCENYPRCKFIKKEK